MPSPFFSVVVPLYNKAQTVAATLTTALAQDYRDFEIVVVDDGSSDGSGQRVEALGDPRIRMIRQSNAGVSVARNRGVEAAAGGWVAFLDADDLWDVDHLSRLASAIRDDRAILVFGNHRLQSACGEARIDVRVPAQEIDNYFEFALANSGYPISASNFAVSRTEMMASGGFEPGKRMGEDTDLLCRLACRGPFRYTAAVTSTYNDEPTPQSVGRNLTIPAIFPPFAERFPEMLANGEMPERLAEGAKRYVNFLLLEYARQLLDRGAPQTARGVLLRKCSFAMDPSRYVRRLARTSLIGRYFYDFARRSKQAVMANAALV